MYTSYIEYEYINIYFKYILLLEIDLIVSYVVIPLEIGWAISVQWYAGNVCCKLLMFIRALAFYLSSMLLVSLTLDRFLAIAHPLASLKSRKCTCSEINSLNICID